MASTSTKFVVTSTGLLALALAGCSTTDGEDTSTDPAPESQTSADAADDTEDADGTEEAGTEDAGTGDDSTADSGDDAAGSGAYADGTYAAQGSYTSPGGQETIDVEVTLEGGVVTAVTVDNPSTTNANSLRYQGEFIDGIAAEVEGVPLDEVSVDVVGGSSLTSGGFEEALETIRAEAAS